MSKPSPGEPETIDINDRSQIERWCRVWQVSEIELTTAVQKAGPAAPAVAFALGKEAYGAA